MLLDESADGEHQMPLEKKSRMIAFLIAREPPSQVVAEHTSETINWRTENSESFF